VERLLRTGRVRSIRLELEFSKNMNFSNFCDQLNISLFSESVALVGPFHVPDDLTELWNWANLGS